MADEDKVAFITKVGLAPGFFTVAGVQFDVPVAQDRFGRFWVFPPVTWARDSMGALVPVPRYDWSKLIPRIIERGEIDLRYWYLYPGNVEQWIEPERDPPITN